MDKQQLADHFADTSEDTLAQVEEILRKKVEDRKQKRPADYFPWHTAQQWVLESPELTNGPVRVLMVSGGNRSGKSKVGMGIASQLYRRESPLNDQLVTTDPATGEIRKKGDKDPLTVWIAPPTLQKARQDWILPNDGMGIKYWIGDRFEKHERSPDNVIFSRVPGLDPRDSDGKLVKANCDKTLFKSHDQKVETFESSEVDACFFDEEIQDEKKWNSVLMRIATNNGFICMTFTPLHGLSWSYERYWRPWVKSGRATKVGERKWYHDPDDPEMGAMIFTQFGTADNPRASAYAKEIEHDPSMSDAEKGARLYGEYGYVEGALLERLAGIDVVTPDPEHEMYVVDGLPGHKAQDGTKVPGSISDWFLHADPNKSYGALLGCVDQDGNLYFVSEHLEESWPTRLHAREFKKMEKKWANKRVQRYADTGSAGAQNIVDLQEYGLFFNPVEKGKGSVSRSIKRLRTLTWIDPDHFHPITQEQGAPRLYFYRPGLVNTYQQDGKRVRGCRLADQISQARQTDNENAPPDTPHKSVRNKLDLFDCARYMAMTAAGMTEKGEDSGNRRAQDPDRLPRDKALNTDGKSDTVEHWTQHLALPSYEYGDQP